MLTADRYGHCVMCHKNMLIEAVIDQKVQKRFTPDYSETEYLLDDGSKMRVAICEQCKINLLPKDENYIMKCVLEGWRAEVEGFNHWTREKKDNYMDRYSKRKIVCLSEKIPQDVLDKKLKEHKTKDK